MELRDTINGMLSDDYKERFIAEYQQVSTRYRKLVDMLIKLGKGELDFTPKSGIDLLINQANIMASYLFVLEIRAIQEGIEIPKVKKIHIEQDFDKKCKR